MKKNKNYVLVLASGGIDSTACINFYKNLQFEIEALFIDYGQLSKKKELDAITSIAEYYKINLIKIRVINNRKYRDGLILGRNAFLCFVALINFRKENGIIAIGIHSGTNYYDCSEKFSKQIQTLFDGYSQGTIKIGIPFLNFNKKEICDYCNFEKVPIYLSYSCELGEIQPCGNCSTCKDLQVIYASKK
ncbi:MAG: 7-cyano-7-deazaguanine synthase [Ignavibacteriaceae bacterium]